jgi:hypothetical protein
MRPIREVANDDQRRPPETSEDFRYGRFSEALLQSPWRSLQPLVECEGSLIMNPSGLRWKKSTRSSDSANCVQVAFDGSTVQVRDSKAPSGPHLHVSRVAWVAFVSEIKANQIAA